MYKILLVDDEEDVRQAIVKKLDWAALGFEVVGEASNGQEALEMAEILQPDVVMTDIKMPFMDGLELCRRVKRLIPGVRLAIFSGFDEFEYAKEAIAQQVEEYILKPITAKELSAVFERLYNTLENERTARRDVEKLRQYHEESLPQLRGHFLSEVLRGRLRGAELQQKASLYGLDFSARDYCVATIRSTWANSDEMEIPLLEASLCQLVHDTLETKPAFYLAHVPDSIQLLFLLQNSSERCFMVDQLEQLFPLARRFLSATLSIGLGGVYSTPDEIPLSALEAERALDYQILVEREQCICIDNIEPSRTQYHNDIGCANEILRQIKVGQSSDLAQAVDKHVTALKESNIGIDNLQVGIIELVAELLRLIRVYKLDPQEAQQSCLLVGHLYKATGFDDLGQRLYNYCENLRTLIRRERTDSTRLLVDRAKDIIDQNYADSELSLDTICTQLNVSPAYFSSVFKRETNQGFVGYLTSLRMSKALELMASTQYKTYQVAEMVGYLDPNYFSYVFKKHFGVSPSKYVHT